MLQTAYANPEAAVIPNFYGGDEPLPQVEDNGAPTQGGLYGAPMILKPANLAIFKNVRVSTDSHVFIVRPDTVAPDKLPEITTVIRIHRSADISVLHNALGCLAAMHNCVCIPLVTAQDFSAEQKLELDSILADYKWKNGREPRVMYFHSTGSQDLRSKLLNEGLLAVETRYAAFLDYDDLLMNHAYDWLHGRLQTSGKAVAFGRVFATAYESKTGRFINRTTPYEYGGSYEEFVLLNHAPLHSFLLDLEKIDLSAVEYHDEHKYMEDYYLTLQLFKSDNADWQSLQENRYLGDYITSVDRQHTLAFSCDNERRKILADPVYQRCESRIQKMRRKISQG